MTFYCKPWKQHKWSGRQIEQSLDEKYLFMGICFTVKEIPPPPIIHAHDEREASLASSFLGKLGTNKLFRYIAVTYNNLVTSPPWSYLKAWPVWIT